MPYGPFLALAAILVMFTWKWIWMFEIDIATTRAGVLDDRSTVFAVRRLCGDWVLLTGLSVVAIGGTAGLMGLLRLFWSIPIPREVREPNREMSAMSLPPATDAPEVVQSPDAHDPTQPATPIGDEESRPSVGG